MLVLLWALADEHFCNTRQLFLGVFSGRDCWTLVATQTHTGAAMGMQVFQFYITLYYSSFWMVRPTGYGYVMLIMLGNIFSLGLMIGR